MLQLAYAFLTILSVLAVISLLIVIHELGHYAVARCFGIRISVVSLGLGRELAGFTARSGTRWRISRLPGGGYVRLAEQDDLARSGPNLRLFLETPLAVRAAFMAGGPAANFAFALLVFAMVFTTQGQRVRQAGIVEVVAGSPADSAGIRPDDRIVMIDGHRIQRFNEIEDRIHEHPGDRLVMVLQRGTTLQTVEVTPGLIPITGEDGRPDWDVRIGIKGKFTDRFIRYPPLQALAAATATVGQDIGTTFATLRQMVQGKRPASQMRGNVSMATSAASAVSSGIASAAWFIASLSVAIGLFNLFPIPVLDGGNLLVYAAEAVLHRPLSHRFVTRATRLGLTVLILLTVWGLRNDILHMLLPRSK